MVREALSPFYDPTLRNCVLEIATASEQILDKAIPEKAQGMVKRFRGL